ncbi:MAG: hypothetical protein K9W45_05910 [Candidatus Heimdallarchaeum aukensis]|uniref:Uncharacterized protein n=1 Tax=Candidatus Heimdallarchaeum aukensis TaxID=2876573 RepID=A0A9Y1FML6_9ARCH|nr:MAG: hypothetical protein K9W45_05910 [Candidatus Heimdallarchaeum aukensis]
MNTDVASELLLKLINQFRYYFIDEANRDTGKDIIDININNIKYFKTAGRFGEVFVVDVYYSSEITEHKKKVAIKFIENSNDALLEIKNTMTLEKKFAARSVVRIPRFIYVNLGDNPFIAYEGITGINYEDAVEVRNKSFWAGYVLAVIHGGQTRKVMVDIYEELHRRLVFKIFGGDEQESTVVEKSKPFLQMISSSMGGCDAFGDFHQSNLMLRITPDNQVITIALIDPTFWMKGSYDRFEDMGTFFGRQSILEYRETNNLVETAKDIRKFLKGYNVHLKELHVPTLEEMYPKGLPIDFYIALWAMMDYIEKTEHQGISKEHPDIIKLKEMTYYLLTEYPILSRL